MSKSKLIPANHPDVIDHLRVSEAGNYRFTAKFRRYLIQQQNGKCYYCGGCLAINKPSIDHKIPRALGGTHDRENLVMACEACNSAKCNSDLEFLRDSIRLRLSPLFGIISRKQLIQLETLGCVLPVEPSFTFYFEEVQL